MSVLVAYATRHGATRGIAERIGNRLSAAGLQVDVRPVGEVRGLEPYDAAVVGSAAYLYHWLKEATALVERQRAALAARPLWLFSSGPIGTDRLDKQGRDVLETTRPKEFDRFERSLHPRATAIFFGAWDPSQPPVGMAERFMRIMPGGRDAIPAGDFRDWAVIDAWADGIAAALGATPPPPTLGAVHAAGPAGTAAVEAIP